MLSNQSVNPGKRDQRMSKTKKRKTQLPTPEEMEYWKEFPDDLVMEILLKLPVKSLVRFRCVSKKWLALIKSPEFISRHHNGVKDEFVLIKSYRQDEEQNVISFYSSGDSLGQVSTDLRIPHFLNNSNVDVLGPSNGLICITDSRNIVLCNPILREFHMLPRGPSTQPKGLGDSIYGLGFGFDPCINDYKVVRVASSTIHRTIVSIYNLSTNLWREVNYNNFPFVDRAPCFELFFNGACHMLVMGEVGGRCILAFRLSSEDFILMQYPKGLGLVDDSETRLVILNECLSMVHHQPDMFRIDIWVMKEYGVKKSWTKQFKLGMRPRNLRCALTLSTWKNHMLLMEEKCQLVSCDLNSKETEKFEIYTDEEETMQAMIYKESLVSVVKH